MSPERERHVLQVVAEALERSPLNRDTFLKDSIGNDRLELAAAESLLAFQARNGTLDSTRTLRGFVPGEEIGGRFRILRFIGHGGMGDVYEAEDVATSRRRRVALKTIRPEMAINPKILEQFEREIELGQRVTHPNVCRVYDLGIHRDKSRSDTILFVTMELLGGETLAERLRRERSLTEPEALALIRQLAEALNAAHKVNVVHRDFKPGNIMLVPQSGSGFRAVVTDFGLAVEIANDNGLNAPLIPAGGTPDYMSPEQVRGDRVGPRSDIYSLGVVAYQLVTGSLPFDGETSLIRMVKRLHEPPVPPRRRNTSLDPRWETAIVRCLEREPEDRFANATDLVEALEHDAPPAGERRTEPLAFLGRHRWRLLAMAAILVVLIWLAAGRIRSWVSPIPQEKRVAVLRFENISGDRGEQAFCEGLMETLSSKLTQLEQFQGSLSVVPASEIRKEKITSAREAKQQFNANLVISGSVQRSPDGLRLLVNLVDANTLRQLRSREVVVAATDAVAMQNGVISQITDLLDIELRPEARQRLAEGNTAVPGAYDFYLQGAGYLRAGTDSTDKAIALFEHALRLDSRYSLAYAGLCEAYRMKYANTKDPQWVDRAWRQCRQAIELSPRSVAARVTLAGLDAATGRYDEAIDQAQQAISIDPASDQAFAALASALDRNGRTSEAEATLKRAIQLRSGYWYNYARLGAFYFRHSRYKEAEEPYRRVIELVPDNAGGYTNLGVMYHLQGREREAEQLLKRSLDIRYSAEAASNLATVYFFQSRYAEAVPLLEKLVSSGTQDYVYWGNLGDAYRWTPNLSDKAPATYTKAVALAKQAVAVNPRDGLALSAMALYRAKLGQMKEAVKVLNEALAVAPDDTTVTFTASIVHAIAGHQQSALQYLAMAVRGGYSGTEIAAEPELRPLRELPQYQAITARTKRPEQ
jgi:serine/threonine protein kinase/tetratricopeptide (TPR) repeat protein